jgi:hypothetical protein
MKKTFILALLSAILVVLSCGSAQAGSATVATFADPSGSAGDPLFTVNWDDATVNGGWADSKSGLDLQISLTGVPFEDAWFEMDEVDITSSVVFGGYTFGETGAGQIRFYADDSTTNPLLQIDFVSGLIATQFFAADDFLVDNVTITGSAIPLALSYEQFSFSFANVTDLPDGNGFTSTASFTSSAVPEPATLCLLGLGGLFIRRKRSKA